jgi:hypothetical protein
METQNLSSPLRGTTPLFVCFFRVLRCPRLSLNLHKITGKCGVIYDSI